MIREILDALFIGHKVDRSPASERLERELGAEHEALMFARRDDMARFWGDIFPTFSHHHDQARARHGL